MNSSSENTSETCFLNQSESSQRSFDREIEIKIGSIKRLIRDLQAYKEEVKEKEEGYILLETDGEDEYVLRKQKQIIDESRRMVLDTEHRLLQVVEKLSKDQTDGRVSKDNIPRIDTLINEANFLLGHSNS